MVSAGAAPQNAAVLLNVPPPGVMSFDRQDVPFPGVVSFAVADFNLDGQPDIAAAGLIIEPVELQLTRYGSMSDDP